MHIRGGRHPLLLAEGVEVIPFDLELSGEQCVLVISGPNTGGKTVLLKAVGLIAALGYAGVIPPVGEGTTLPVFRRISAVIGDHQSIAANLSTFSAHVQRLRDALAGADAAALVLVDEIASGTDPVEGAALAGAVLLELVARRALTVVTTHLSQLKDLAARTAGMENASLAFDAENLAPTYRLLQGVPGRSYGLVIAGRLGVPSSVLRRAESLLPAEERSLDALLADAERRAQGLEERASELAGLEARLAVQREVLNELQQQLNARERELALQGVELEKTGREQARAFLLEARKRVEEALGLARAAVTEATAREARRLVEEGVKREAEALKKLDQAAREKGWTVRGTGKGEGGRVKQAPTKASYRSPFPVPPSPEIDLRGLTGDEAETVLVGAIDNAVVGDLRRLRVIHGKGTGALRARVQQVLKGDARIASFRSGEAPEGGTGVTMVELAP
jgi:DNA mismatch repair protein MutS2